MPCPPFGLVFLSLCVLWEPLGSLVSEFSRRFFAISAKLKQNISLQATYYQKNACFWWFSMLQNTKKHWKPLKNLCFFNDFAYFTAFRFSACWHQFWPIFQWFSVDLALKIIVEALICFPLASLGSNWGQLSASLGNLGSPQSSIFDALPCLGNIFCDLGPPRCVPRQIFQEFWSKCIKIQPKYHQVLNTWAVRGLHKRFTS